MILPMVDRGAEMNLHASQAKQGMAINTARRFQTESGWLSHFGLEVHS